MTFTISAEETRQVDKHEHGVGELNIAVEGSTIEFEFMIPGADIVGFEYVAKSDDDIAKILGKGKGLVTGSGIDEIQSEFDQTNKIMDCMIKGINETMAADPYDVLDRANLGYCQLFKFKCAATRTCDAWLHGGPIRD